MCAGMADRLCALILDFFTAHVRVGFPQLTYTFDVYIDKSDKVCALNCICV
jgi:hypothetical protein